MSIGLKIQLGIAAAALLFVGAFFLWLKVKPRSDLGGPCQAAIDCAEGTELCLKPSGSHDGVCTKQCDADADCGPGLVCTDIDITEVIVDAEGDVSQNEFADVGYCFQAP